MTFNKLPFTSIYECNRVVIDGSRHYVCPKGNYPSVTTVLSATDDPTILANWRKRVGEAEANRISNEATTKGTGLHSLCENYVVDAEINDVSNVPGASKTMFKHVRSALDQNLTGYFGTEIALYSDKLRMAGSTDLIGTWKHIPAVVDFKSNHKPDHKKEDYIMDYKVQVCAYSLMWEELYPEYPKLEKGVLIIASLFHRQIFEFDIMEGYKELIRRRKMYFEMFGK